MYVLLLLLVMALTGLTWSFQWYSKGFYALFGVSEVPKSGAVAYAEQAKKEKSKAKGDRNRAEGAREKGRNDAAACAMWQTAYDALRARNPEYEQITVSDGTAEVAFGGLGNQRAADKYTFDKSTGSITSALPYADSARSSKLRGWIMSVHMGTWGGMLTRLLWFVAALFGATLPLTGYYLWIRRLRRRAR